MAAALIGLLNEAAGEYVESLESSQLDFSGMLTGKVLLKHLQLKKKSFEILPLPAEPEFNYIGRVELDVPVYSLGTAPLLAEVRDILLVLSVKPSDSWDADAFLAQYHEQKASTLAAGEYKALFSSLERGLLWQLLLKLLSSFTARVKDVHIRIEDRQSLSSKPFALGICLKSAILHAAPKGGDFSELGVCKANGGLADDTFFKVISVEGLGVYLDSLSVPAAISDSLGSTPRHTDGSTPEGDRASSAAGRGDRGERRRSYGSSNGGGGGLVCRRSTTWGKSYNESCREAYEDITAQVLQEETSEARRPHGGRRRSSQVGFLAATSAWTGQRDSPGGDSKCPGVTGLCCNTRPSHSPSWDEETVSPTGRGRGRRRSSIGSDRLADPTRDTSTASSSSSSATPSWTTFSIQTDRARALAPDPAESWVPLLRRYQREESPAPKEGGEGLLAAAAVASRVAHHGASKGDHQQRKDSMELLSYTGIENAKFFPSSGHDKEAGEASGTLPALPKRPSFLPPLLPQQPEQQQPHQATPATAAAAAASPSGAATGAADDGQEASADPADGSSQAEATSRERSSAGEEVTPEEGFYDAQEATSPSAVAAGAALVAAARESSAAALPAKASAPASGKQQQQQKMEPPQPAHMQPLDKTKLNQFREFFASLWDVQHEYVLSPDTFKGQGKMFLTLVPTLPPDAPLERCWSPWGQQRAAERDKAESKSKSLPSCTLFLTLPTLKLTVDSMQALQLWKWLEFSFILHGAWQAGLLGTFEKARASPRDTQRYLLCWPVKLLRCPHPISVLKDAERLLTSKEDAELASKGGADAALQQHKQQQQQQQQQQKLGHQRLLQPDEQQQDGEDGVLDGLETLEEVDAFCATFEERHSLQTICVLRAKALKRLVALRELLSSQEERQSTWRRVWHWLTRGLFSKKHEVDLAAAQGDPRKLAAASVNIVEGFMEQNGVSSSRLRQVREHFFSVDFALDLVLSDLQVLVVCEGRGVAVPAPRYGQRLLAIECACLHYHLQIGVTGDQTLSMDVEVYPTTVLTVARDLESSLIPPEVSVLLLLEPSRQKTKRRRRGNVFLDVLQKVLGRGDGSGTEAADAQPHMETLAPIAAGAATDDDDARSMRSGGGTAGRRLSAAAQPSEEALGREKDYRKKLDGLRAWSPGVYMRMDSQLFRTLHAPDLRMLLHSCAGIVVVVSPQRCLLVLGESLNLLDAARTKELLLSSNIQRAALLRQGEAFCSAVAGGDIQHPNVLLDVELQKTVSFVVPRLASRLDCEGVQLDFGSLKAKSLLQPRRLTYPPDMNVASLLDSYSCELAGLTVARTPSCSRDLLRLPMFLGGLVLPFPRRLSSVLQLSAAAAAAAATATGGPLGGEHQQAPETWGYGDAAGEPPLLQPSPAAAAAPRGHKGGKHERDASHPHAGERKREASGSKRTVSGTSFLVQPVKTSALSLKVDIIQESIAVSVSQHDIELLANIAAESLEIFYSYSSRLEAIFRDAEQQQAALDACILQQMQAKCVELEQEQQKQLLQQAQEGDGRERKISHTEEETVVSSVAAAGIDHTTALIGTQLAISRSRAQEALVSASNTLINNQQGDMCVEIHCVLAGLRVFLLRRGPTISCKEPAGEGSAPENEDTSSSVPPLSAGAPPAAAAAAAAGPSSAALHIGGISAARSAAAARQQQSQSPPGSPRRQHHRRRRHQLDSPPTAAAPAAAAGVGGLFSGFVATATSALEGLAAQQLATSLISGDGGGEGAPPGSLAGATTTTLSGTGYGGWLSVCLPLTEPSVGEAYRPYQTVAPLVTLLLGECFIQATTSTDGHGQLHVALQGVELRDDTNIAPLCLSSLYLGSGVLDHPPGETGAAGAAAAAAGRSEIRAAASRGRHHRQHYKGDAASSTPSVGHPPAVRTPAVAQRRGSAVAQHLADSHLVHAEQRQTSKRLARARTSVVVVEAKAIGPPTRQRKTRGSQPQEKELATSNKTRLGSSGDDVPLEDEGPGDDTSGPENADAGSLCPLVLCCPRRPHLEVRLRGHAMEETADCVVSLSKARFVVVWEVVREVLQVMNQLAEELPAFPPAPPPLPPAPPVHWGPVDKHPQQRARFKATTLTLEEELDAVVKRLLLARNKQASMQNQSRNVSEVTIESRWYSFFGGDDPRASGMANSALLSGSASVAPHGGVPHENPPATPAAAAAAQRGPSLAQQFGEFSVRSCGRSTLEAIPTFSPKQQQAEQQQQPQAQQQQQQEPQKKEGEEVSPEALPHWVPLESGGISNVFDNGRLLRAIEETRFGHAEVTPAFADCEAEDRSRSTYAGSAFSLLRHARPWGLPLSAFTRGESVRAVACGGGPESFNKGNQLPRLQLLLRMQQAEIWLPAEPIRMPLATEGDSQAANNKRSTTAAGSGSSHSERRRQQQQQQQHGEGADGDGAKHPALGYASSGAAMGLAGLPGVAFGKKGRNLLNKLRFDHGASVESRGAPTEPSTGGGLLGRRRKADLVQQQQQQQSYYLTPETLLGAPAGFISGLASAAAGVASATAKGRRALLGGGRSNTSGISSSQPQQQLLHGSSNLNWARRAFVRQQRPTAADYWKGIRRLVIRRHRLSPEGTAAIAACAATIPKVIALSAGFEVTLSLFFLQQKQQQKPQQQQQQQQQRLLQNGESDAEKQKEAETIITELEHVRKLETSGASPVQALAPLCPCLIRCGVSVSNICIVTTQPELLSPLLPCAVAWEPLRLNSPLLSPTRLQLRAALCLPSFSTLNERVCGISPEASATIRRRYGILKAMEPEGLAFNFDADPMLITLDTFSVVFAYQLLAIAGAVAAEAAEIFSLPPSHREGSRGVGGDVSDTFTSAPKSLAATSTPQRPHAAAPTGGAPCDGYLAAGHATVQDDAAAALGRHTFVASGGALNPVLESFIAEQHEQQQKRQQQQQQQQQRGTTPTDGVPAPRGVAPPHEEPVGALWTPPEEEREIAPLLTAEEALEGLLHTTAIAVEVSGELFRVALWDTFSVSRKCCFSFTIEDVELKVVSRPRCTETIPYDPESSTLAACSDPFVVSCCAALQQDELAARQKRLRMRYRRLQAPVQNREGRSTMQQHIQEQLQRQVQEQTQQQQDSQLQHADSTTGTKQQQQHSSSFVSDQSSRGPPPPKAPMTALNSQISNTSSRQQRRIQKRKKLQQRLQQQLQQQESGSGGHSGALRGPPQAVGDASSSYRRRIDGERDTNSSALGDNDRLQMSESLQALPWTETRREATGSDIASVWSTGDVCWRLWRDLEQHQNGHSDNQQQQQQQLLLDGRQGLPSACKSEAGPMSLGSVGTKQQGGALKHKRHNLVYSRHQNMRIRPRTTKRGIRLPKAFRRWLVSQYRMPSTPGGAGGGPVGTGGAQGMSKSRETAELGAAGARLRRVVMASDPWVTADAAFVVSAEHLNRLEGTTDATLEPWRVETVGSKACLSSPTLLDVHASWVNLNINVALVDALLVYGYALIGVVVRQRSLLLLNQRRLGPKLLPGGSGGPAGRDAGTGWQTGAHSTQAGGSLRKGESAEIRSMRQPPMGPPTEEMRALQQQLQQQGLCGSEGSELSQALALAAAAAAEVPGCYAVLRPDGTVVGSSGFDLFAPLEAALSLELLGDHLLQKSSGHMSPSAEFAGDQLKDTHQQHQQPHHLAAVAADGTTEKENGKQTQQQSVQHQQQQQQLVHAAAAADGGSHTADPTGKAQENANPLLYNLLGQPIAVMTRIRCDDGADVLSGSWFVVNDQASFALPLDESNRVLPFLVRLRLFNYVYDLPSQIFCFTAETREVVRLSVPEQPLPPTIHMHHGQGIEGGDEVSDAPKKKRIFGRVAKAPEGSSAGGSGLGGVRRSQGGGKRASAGLAAKMRRRGWWVPAALPRPRNFAYLLWRTSAFASVSGTPRHDLFLSSCISLRNNTELSLAILPTVPGPSDERRSVFAAFRKKFVVQPSKPPTSSMPPIARVMDAFKHQERRSKKRQTQQQQQRQQQSLRTFPPALKLPAMEHYILEDTTNADIGRKFSMVAENPFSDDEAAAAGATGAAATGAAAAIATAFATSTGPQPGGRVKFAMEGLMEQEQQLQRRMQSSGGEGTGLAPAEQQQTEQQLLLKEHQLHAQHPDGAGAEAAGTGADGSDARMQDTSDTTEDDDENRETAEGKGQRSSRNNNLQSPSEDRKLLSPRERAHRRNREKGREKRPHQRTRRKQSHSFMKQIQVKEKIPLVQGVDYLVLDGKERQLLPVPLYWLLTENAPLWCCLAERLPKYKHNVRRFVANPKNADFLADEKSQRAISGGLLARYRPKRSALPPKQIHIDEGVALSASIVGIALRSSGMARGNVEGLFFEVVIENCLYVCNRLPRPITLRFLPQDCGGLPRQQQQQQQQQQQMLTFDSFIPQPPTEIQIEAGEEVSLAADPAHITVYFGGRVSRPVEVDYFMPGTAVQRVTMENCNDDTSSPTAGFSPGGRGSAGGSADSSEASHSVSLDARMGEADERPRRDRTTFAFAGEKALEEEPLHEPAAVLLWGEVTDHTGTAKAANSATAQRLYHGTFVRTLTFFADFWVVNRTGYMLLLRRHGNGWLQSLPPFQRVVLSHDFGASRLSVGLPASQYSKVKDFDLYSRKEKTRLSRCLQAAFSSRTDTAAWSGEFLLSDMGAYQIQLDKTETNPLLHYSVSMGIAPAPFSRTTVVEILPSYVLVNETQKYLWVCEAGGGPDARCHMLGPGTLMEFHPQGKRPVAILLTAVPQKGLVRRHARADLSWEASGCALASLEGKALGPRSSTLQQQQQQQQDTGASDASGTSPKSASALTGSQPKKVGVAGYGGKQSLQVRATSLQQQMQQQQQQQQQQVQQQQQTPQGTQRQASPSASSRGAGAAGSRSVSLHLPHHGESEVATSCLSSEAAVRDARPSLTKPLTYSGNTWQLDDEDSSAEGSAGMVWSGPVDIDSARLVQVRHPQEVRFGEHTAAATAAGRPLTRGGSSSQSSSGSAFCLTEVEVCLYAGAKFVRLHEAAIPDFVLLNKTSFPLFVGQHGVPAYEVVPPVPRQHLKRSYEFLGRYGLPFAFYDPTKEKKLEVWRMSNAAPLGHRLSGRLSHLHSRLRSGSRLGSASRVSGYGGLGGPPGMTSRLQGRQISGTAGRRSSLPLSFYPGKGQQRRAQLQSAVSGGETLPKFDADTLRRIRREYAESISLKTTQGQQGLIRLVLQSSAGPATQGGPPPPVDRVVVCVRRPVVKGSTYLVFFEATRSTPEMVRAPSGGTMIGTMGMGYVKEQMQHLGNLAGAMNVERPEAFLVQEAEGAWHYAGEEATHVERYLPWPGGGGDGNRQRSMLPPGGTIPPLAAAPQPGTTAAPGLSAVPPQKPIMTDGKPVEASGGSPVVPSSAVALSQQGAHQGPEVPPEQHTGLRPPWAPVEGWMGAADEQLRLFGGAAESKAFEGAATMLKKRPKRLASYRRRRYGDAGDQVGESDEEEPERPPLCSTDLSVNLFLVGAGLSLIDSKPAEIFYASLELLQVFFKSSQEGEKLRLTVGWVQIDNHTPLAYYPTMLRPITDLRANVNPEDISSSKPVKGAPSRPGTPPGALGGGAASPATGSHDQAREASGRSPRGGSPGPASPRLGGGSHHRRHAQVAVAHSSSAEGGSHMEERDGTSPTFPIPTPRSRLALADRRRSLSCIPLKEAEDAKALHSETEGLKLMQEEDAVAQLILERRTTMDGRGLTVIPQCVLRLAPLSINIDFQLAFAVLLFVDDLLRTIDLDLLQQSVKDIRTSETETDSASWRAMLGPVDGALAEVIRSSGDGAGKVYLGTLDVGRIVLVINIRNKRRGGEEEEQPHSELIRGVLAIMKSSPYISDANLVFASEVHQSLCGPLVALVSDILQKYIGQAIKQIFQLLGAVDLFGNPVIMCKHWKSGAVGCFFEVRRGLALWGTPGFAFLSFGRGFARFGTAFVAGFLDSFGRFFGSWYQCLEAFSRNSDAYSVMPDIQGQGGITDQPGSIAEGLVTGGKGFAFTFALSLTNFCVKPVKAMQVHLSQHSSSSKSEKLTAGAKGLGIGVASGLGSLCFGVPSSLLLLLSSSCVGALNQIQAVPMLESVRPRRVFGVGGWRTESYSFALALAQSALPRSSRPLPAQLLFALPVCRQRDDGDGPPDRGERLQRLEQRLQEHSRIRHHQRRRKTHLLLVVGLRKIGLLDGRKILWSCFRGDVAQIQVAKSYGDHNNPANCSFFLSLLYFKEDGRPTPDEGLARHVKEGLKQRAELGDVKVQTPESSTGTGSSYRSSTDSSSSSSSSSSSNTYSDEDGTDDLDYEYSDSSSDISGVFGRSSSGGPPAAAPQAAPAPPAEMKSIGGRSRVEKDGTRIRKGDSLNPTGRSIRKTLTSIFKGSSAKVRSHSHLSTPRLSQQQEPFPQQQEPPQQQPHWAVLKKAKVGEWLLGRAPLGDDDPLKQKFAFRWIEFPSERAALQAFDVLSHLLDSAPGQGAADPTLFLLL